MWEWFRNRIQVDVLVHALVKNWLPINKKSKIGSNSNTLMFMAFRRPALQCLDCWCFIVMEMQILQVCFLLKIFFIYFAILGCKNFPMNFRINVWILTQNSTFDKHFCWIYNQFRYQNYFSNITSWISA